LKADARDFVYIEYFLDPYDLGPYLMPTLFIADAIKPRTKQSHGRILYAAPYYANSGRRDNPNGIKED